MDAKTPLNVSRPVTRSKGTAHSAKQAARPVRTTRLSKQALSRREPAIQASPARLGASSEDDRDVRETSESDSEESALDAFLENPSCELEGDPPDAACEEETDAEKSSIDGQLATIREDRHRFEPVIDLCKAVKDSSTALQMSGCQIWKKFGRCVL